MWHGSMHGCDPAYIFWLHGCAGQRVPLFPVAGRALSRQGGGPSDVVAFAPNQQSRQHVAAAMQQLLPRIE